jgi:ribonuclease E
MAIEVMRTLMTRASLAEVRRVDLEVHQRVADYMINKKRREMTQLEEGYNVTVNVQIGMNVGPEHLKVRCLNDVGAEILVPSTSADSYSRR